MRDCETAVQSSDWDTAVVRCEEALAALPDAYGIHYFLGFAHQGRQEWERAGGAFESFVTAGSQLPENAQRPTEQITVAVRSAGIAWSRAEDVERALPLLRRAAEADPNDAEVHFFLGIGLLRQNDAEGAEMALSVVVREAPQISQASFFLGQLRYDAEDYGAAVDHLGRYLETAPEGAFAADAHWMAGSIALRSAGSEAADTGAADRAKLHFTALIEVEPESQRAAVAHYFLGTIAAEREECQAARRHYEEFLRLAPGHERASEVRGYLEEGFAPCGPAPGNLSPAFGALPGLC